MSDQNTPRQEQRTSRLAGQPAPQRLGPPVPDGPRPSYEELQAQAAAAGFSALAQYLSAADRDALGLPAEPKEVVIDHETAQRARAYFLANPERLAVLPDAARDLLTL